MAFNRIYEFNNLDLFSCQDLDCPGTVSPNLGKPLAPADPTALPDMDHDIDQEFFFQKSTENLTNGYEISFQKNFMKEHEAVYLKELKNCVESFRIHQNKTGVNFSLTTLTQTLAQQHPIRCEELLQKDQLSLEGKKTLKLLEKLGEFDKLSEFLDIVVSKTPKFMVNELLELALILVEQYEKVMIEIPNENDLLLIASDAARSINLEKLISVKGISFAKGKETAQLIEVVRKFTQVFCATVMLVSGQYFGNPYAEEECGGLKRPLSPWSVENSDEEEDFEPSPSKKRKFSF